jgi:hypothetical protein
MVVEHSFITTLEAADALRTAAQFLNARGFEAVSEGAFTMGPSAWNALEMTRGTKKVRKAKSVIELQQQVRIEWDRGRVSVAASALSPQEAQATGWNVKPTGKAAKLQEEMLVGLASHLQQLLEGRADAGQLSAMWGNFETRLHEQDRSRRRRRGWIVLIIVGFFLAFVVTMIVIAANSH